jgi:hypothetical protein
MSTARFSGAHRPEANTTTNTTMPMSTRIRRGAGLLETSTYAISLHLVTDLVVGTVTFSVMVTLLATSAGLMITLLGIPLLMGTLLAARGIGAIERWRAGSLLGPTKVVPARHEYGLRARLSDAGDWKAVAYSLLLFPVGVVTGTVTVVGWASAAAAITAPAYAGRFDDSSRRLAGINLEGPVAGVASVLAGVALLILMPTIVRNLARVQTKLVRQLLT